MADGFRRSVPKASAWRVLPRVAPQLILPMKALSAAGGRAHEAALLLMGPPVLRQVGGFGEGFATYLTLQRLLASVGSFVHCCSAR
jgi:hypothetical protein